MLSPEELQRLRQRLLNDRATVESRIQARIAELGSAGGQGVSDRGDDSQSIFARERAIDDNDLDRELLGRIDKALARIDAGTYGVSEASGKPIPIERLEALPTATTLVDEEPPES